MINVSLLIHKLVVEYQSPETTLILSVIAIMLMWANLIYWFRLFETTTLYIRLITQTISDMRAFLLIFILVTMMFGNAIFIMQ